LPDEFPAMSSMGQFDESWVEARMRGSEPFVTDWHLIAQ
jgi:hypothetical protein